MYFEGKIGCFDYILLYLFCLDSAVMVRVGSAVVNSPTL